MGCQRNLPSENQDQVTGNHDPCQSFLSESDPSGSEQQELDPPKGESDKSWWSCRSDGIGTSKSSVVHSKSGRQSLSFSSIPAFEQMSKGDKQTTMPVLLSCMQVKARRSC